MFSCGEVQVLFSKELIVVIKDGAVNRRVRLHLTLENLTTSAPLVRKELIVRLTDECDPFFLFALTLNEDDFPSLKNEQSLLVEFPAFPQNVIDLLEQCIKEECKDNPRFLLTLVIPSRSGLDTNPAIFDIVETNPFKHLVHLRLKLLPASDANVKKFLGKSLKALREEKEKLERRLYALEDEFKKRHNQDQENYSHLSQEFVKMETKYKTELATKESQFRDHLTAEKERLEKLHREEELRWEKEKSEREKNYQVKIHLLEDSVTQLESIKRDLNDKLYKSESLQKKLHSRVATLEEEIQQLHQKLKLANTDQATLDSKFQQQLITISELKRKISFSEEVMRNSEQKIESLEVERNNLLAEKRRLEEDIKTKDLEINREKELRHSVEEDAKKANDIIRKMYKSLECSEAKVKLQAIVMDKQEKVIEDLRERGKKADDELATTKRNLKEKKEEASKATKALEEMKKELEECKKQIKTNENVIKWLNKQHNEKLIENLRSSSNEKVSAVTAVKQTLNQPTISHLMYHDTVPTTAAPSYIHTQFPDLQKMKQPFRSTLPLDNPLRKNYLNSTSAAPLPSHYFEKSTEKTQTGPTLLTTKILAPSANKPLNPKMTDKQEMPTTQFHAVSNSELLTEPESPRPGPPPTCTQIQSVR